MINEKNFLQEYKDRTIMKEGYGGTYLIFRKKKFFERLIPDFIIPDEIVLARGIQSMEDAKIIIDRGHYEKIK